MRKVAIIGVGMSAFGKQPEKEVVDLGYEATLSALRDANISPDKIEFAYCSNFYHIMVLGQTILSQVGITNREVINVENICAGGATAFRGVWYGIASGMYDVGLVLGVESMSNSGMAGKLLPPSKYDLEGQLGMSMPLSFALFIRRHMHLYGTTVEQIAKIAIKNHHNGCLNPFCLYKKEFSIEEILQSRMICDPITAYMCCANTDGAAALVLCTEKIARKYTTKPIFVAASSLKMGDYRYLQEDISFSNVINNTAKEAYKMAGVGPEDLNLVECHDPIASNEILHYEELELCQKGEGGKLVEDGITEITGKIPVNPSGGLIALGHPVSASGVRQLADITIQLRGNAGERQIPRARVGLAQIVGGSVTNLDAGAAAVHILKR